MHSYWNQSIDLQSKSINWFLYDNNFGVLWVKKIIFFFFVTNIELDMDMTWTLNFSYLPQTTFLLVFYIFFSLENDMLTSTYFAFFNKHPGLSRIGTISQSSQGWNLFFNKVAGWKPRTLFKKRRQYRCIPVNFASY